MISLSFFLQSPNFQIQIYQRLHLERVHLFLEKTGDTYSETRLLNFPKVLSLQNSENSQLPPVIIISDFLYLMVSYAKPIAWFAEEHAEDTVKLGPCIWNSIEIKLVAELFMIFGMVRGCNLLCPSS